MNVEKEVGEKWASGITWTDGRGSCMKIAFSKGTRLSQRTSSVEAGRSSIFYPTAAYRDNLRRAFGPKPALR